MTINELQQEVVEEFADITDWMDKYQMLIDLGNEMEPLDEKYKTESNLIDGCQSRVWIQADYKDGLLLFSAESDPTPTPSPEPTPTPTPKPTVDPLLLTPRPDFVG